MGCLQAHIPCPGWGLTRRLRRGLGFAVPRGAHTFLSVAKEKCAKESQRHGDYGKKASIAHFDGGARNVARNGVGQLSPALGARSCSPFSAVKMGGPFSLRCLSPLCSPAGGVGHTQMAVLGIVSCYVGGLAASMGRPVFQFAVGVNHIQIIPVGRFDVTWIFLQGKRPA